MARWAPLKKDQLEALASEILHNYGRGRTMVAVDGASDAGTRQFADDLADTLRTMGHSAFRASVDDFRTPRGRREPHGQPDAAAVYNDGYDYSVLQRVLLEPFRATSGTGFVLAAFDARRDAPIQSKWTTAGPDALLLIDGPFLNRPQLADRWNYSIWVERARSEDDTLARQESELDGDEAEAVAGADAIYLAEVDPRTKAMAIIDNTDADSPRRMFADSC
jgi:uridine kinase